MASSVASKLLVSFSYALLFASSRKKILISQYLSARQPRWTVRLYKELFSFRERHFKDRRGVANHQEVSYCQNLLRRRWYLSTAVPVHMFVPCAKNQPMECSHRNQQTTEGWGGLQAKFEALNLQNMCRNGYYTSQMIDGLNIWKTLF